MTIPVTSYQIGTTPVQYTQDPNLNPNINTQDLTQIPDNIKIPEPDDVINNPNAIDVTNNIHNNNNQYNDKKYNIMDLFWLLNPNYLKKQIDDNPQKKEAEFIVLSYNLDYGNLRTSLYSMTPEAIQGNVIFLQSMKLLVSGTIYPASAFKILNIDGNIKFTCIEQLVTNTGANWQKVRPVVQLEKNNDYISLNIHNRQTNNVFYYKFETWQLKAFQSALKLTYTNGLNLRSNI